MRFLLVLIFIPSVVCAEYRVFKLRIVNSKTQKSRVVHSTLDWLQYPQYHHLKRDEYVELVDHWMCWKRSDNFDPLCKRPVTLDSLKSENEQPQS